MSLYAVMPTRWVAVESEAMSIQLCAAAEVAAVRSVQVAPESSENQISPSARTRCFPVESETMVGPTTNPAVEFTVVRFVHVAPPSAEVQTSSLPGRIPVNCVTATRLVPVASDATDCQYWPDAVVPFVRLVQVAPASAEVQMFPSGLAVPMVVTATRLVPVASEATSTQGKPAAVVPTVRLIQVPALKIVVPDAPPPSETTLPPAPPVLTFPRFVALFEQLVRAASPR
jgi:hypothetical protein